MNKTSKAKRKNDPNANYAMYEQDRVVKRESQTIKAETGEGNAPRVKRPNQFQRTMIAMEKAGVVRRDGLSTRDQFKTKFDGSSAEPLEITDRGEQCVVCGKDSWTCEHFEVEQPSETFAERAE